MKKTSEDRLIGPDIIRVVACFLVILVHVSAIGFTNFSDFWKICIAYDSIARMCVPLFFMLSGYFLLNAKIMPVGTFYKKRLLKLLLPFIITLAIYFSYKDWSSYEFFYRLVSQNVDFHLWFVYTLIGIYLFVPVVQNLFLYREGRDVVKIYIIVWFLFEILYNTVHSYFGFSFNIAKSVDLHYFFGFLGYVFVGALLRELRTTYFFKLFFAILCGVSTVCIYALTVEYSYFLNSPSQLFFDYLSIFVFFQAVSFFIAIKDINANVFGLSYIAKHTYWIYLIHVMVMGRFFYFTKLEVSDNALIVVPVATVSIFIASFLISIPLLKLENEITKMLMKIKRKQSFL